MALINCKECNKEVSDKASNCPGCGAPIAVKPEPKPGDFIPYTDQEVAVLLSKKPKTSHLLHLLLSVLTVGFWVIIWIIVAVNNSIECSRIDNRIAKGKKHYGWSQAEATTPNPATEKPAVLVAMIVIGLLLFWLAKDLGYM